MTLINLPYLPENKEIIYVSDTDEFLQKAKETSQKYSLDPDHKVGCVIVKEGKIIGFGGNGSVFHKKNGCNRKYLNIPTGEGYHLCEGCHHKNHAEARAIADVKQNFPENFTEKLSGSDLYLWGHWWCCKHCWKKMLEVHINNVYLWEHAHENFR